MTLFGWRTEGEPPQFEKAVLIASPHTTNWDLPHMLAAAWVFRLRISWLGKHTLFRPPFGWLLRLMGGVPVDRRGPHGFVQQAAKVFLSARFPRAGGALVYVQEGLRLRVLAVAVGLATATAGAISAATVSLGFVAYLAEVVPVPAPLALAIVVLGVGGIAAWGVKESVVVAGVVTLVEIGGLVAVLVYGGAHLATGAATPLAEVFVAGPTASDWPVILQSVVLCFYAFLGFEDIVNVAEEVCDAPRVMPRAIIWTLAISTTLYFVVTAVAVLVVPPEELGRSEAPLALVFERSGGPSMAISVVALVAMLNGALVQIVMASRILMSLSRDGTLPAWLGWIPRQTGTPLAATALVVTIVGVLATALPMARLAAATASVALSVFVLVNVSFVAVLLRERRERGEGARSVPMAVPAIGAVASVVFLAIELLERAGVLG